MDKVSEKVIKALGRLGYSERKFRGGSLHARRGADHLIIKLTKSGRLKAVSGHRDIPDKRHIFHIHRAIKGRIGRDLIDEFKMAYETAKSSRKG